MQSMIEKIEKELETLRELHKVNVLDNYESYYEEGIHTGICMALAIVYKIKIENISITDAEKEYILNDAQTLKELSQERKIICK